MVAQERRWERMAARRTRSLRWQRLADATHLVFASGSGSHVAIDRYRDRAPCGERARAEAPHSRGTALVLEGVLTHPTYRGRSAPRRCQPAPPPCPRIHSTDPRTGERRRRADCSARRPVCRSRRLVCRSRRRVCRSRRLVCRSRRRAMHTRRAISDFRPSRARGPWAKSPTFAPPPSPDGPPLGGGRERGRLRPGTWGRRFGSSSPDPRCDPHDLPGGA